MANKRFNWGILGPGRIANQFAEGLKVIDEAVLYAVASTNLERARVFAEKYRGEKIYGSYEALVNDPKVDAVYIATPHRSHYENILLCLNAGKPVLCEKPLNVNAAETAELIKIAGEKKVFLMEALWSVYLPIYSQIRHWLDSGAIGEIKFLASTFGGNIPKDQGDRWLNPELAGGTLLDMGVYPIAISQWVMQQNPTSFSAKAFLGNTGVDELTAVLLQYENGVISQLSSNFFVDHANEFRIFGTKGHITIPEPWSASQATLVTGERELTVKMPFHGGGFEFETEEAMNCIRQGLLESPQMPWSNTLANMQLMDSIRAEIGLKYPFEK
jgi:dihydrodiol dehydrogenase / D-xylose 1-dehydrogenase (NADP)